jgi:hypothetical protein
MTHRATRGTIVSATRVSFGAVFGHAGAVIAGLVGLSLVVLSCRLSAKNGEWSRWP